MLKYRYSVVLIVLVAAVACGGCGERGTTPKGAKVVARINSYELTTDDFRDEMRADPQKPKEEFLDEIITKKILLQEAQRQNFDKDRAFMKEIERYWEQALLKLLIKKKMDELSRSVVVKEDEIRAEYERLARDLPGAGAGELEAQAAEIRDEIYSRKAQALFEEWLKELKAGADVKIYKENL
jgi:hypothetical protein